MAVQSGSAPQAAGAPRAGTHAVAGALAAAAFYLIATPIAILARALGVGRRAGTPVWHERGVADSSRHS